MIDINGAEKAEFNSGFKDSRLGSQPHKYPSTPPRMAALSTQSHTPSKKHSQKSFPCRRQIEGPAFLSAETSITHARPWYKDKNVSDKTTKIGEKLLRERSE